MSAPVTGCDLGQALCKVFGLDPDVTATIIIKSVPRDIARVHIERFVTNEEVAMLTKVLTEYKLTDGRDISEGESADAKPTKGMPS